MPCTPKPPGRVMRRSSAIAMSTSSRCSNTLLLNVTSNAAIGSSVDDGYYDRRGGWVRYERQVRYQPAPVYYSTPSYRPYYESEQMVYVQPPVYESYSDIYAGYPYGAPYYSVRYASPRYGHYAPRHGHYVPRHGHYDYRHRY